MNRWLFLCGFIGSVVTSQSVFATSSQSHELAYRVQWGNSFLGRTVASWEFDANSYQLSGTAKSEGALSFFYDFTGDNQLTGKMVNGTYQPVRFSSQSAYNKEAYDTEITWQDGQDRPDYRTVPEPDLEKYFPLDEATLDNVTDPYSAMLTALDVLAKTGSCDGTYRLFDGRRRSDLTLVDLGKATLEADRPWSFSGDAVICGSANKLLGGHQRDSDFDNDEEPDFEKVKIYVAKLHDKLMPVRIEIDNFFGDVIVRLNVRDSRF